MILKPGESLFELLKTDQLHFFEEVTRIHGDYVHVQVGNRRIHLVHELSSHREIFFEKSSCFGKAGQLNLLGHLLGQGLLTSDGDLHAQQRRIFQPFFHPSSVRNSIKKMQEVTARRLNHWQSGELSIDEEMNALTLEILGESLFGVRFREVGPSLKELFDYLFLIFHRNFYPERQTKILEEISPDEKIEEFRQFLKNLLEKLIQERKQKNSEGVSILDRFLTLQESQQMTAQQLRDEMVTLLFAGHETTSVALSWTLYHLAQSPVVTQKVKEEIKAASASGSIQMENFRQLPFLMAVLKESMRLNPPVWNITRKVLNDVQIQNHQFKAGDLVFVSPFILHRDPKHFLRPLEFLPERWLDASLDTKNTYIPFGLGARRCIGENFAMVEAAVILSGLLEKFTPEKLISSSVKALGLTTLKPFPEIKIYFSKN